MAEQINCVGTVCDAVCNKASRLAYVVEANYKHLVHFIVLISLGKDKLKT